MRGSWLHFSDIHVGQPDQNWLWPRFKTKFLEDITSLYRKHGGWDALIFSGDMTLKGAVNEFCAFDEVLDDIYICFDKLGIRPKLITVPGNHDLQRPLAASPFYQALSSYNDNRIVQDAIWKDKDSSYIDFIRSAFAEYTSWMNKSIAQGRHAEPIHRGVLPGDASYIIDAEGGTIAIVGLNSTWLQLSSDNYERRLAVHPEQIMAITERDPDTFVQQAALRLLVTHQPDSWLAANVNHTWENDINPPGRFDFHLYGHMHEPQVTSIARGGGSGKQTMQAASLFGLETLADGKQDRVQGYSASWISQDDNGTQLKHSPRILQLKADKSRTLGADPSFHLNDDNQVSFVLNARSDLVLHANSGSINKVKISQIEEIDANDILSKLRASSNPNRSHFQVRRVEQQQCIEALTSERIAWIAGDWGVGLEGFLWSVAKASDFAIATIFKLDASSYQAAATFSDRISLITGVRFDQFSEVLAASGKCIFVLDDFPVSEEGEGLEREADLIRFVRILRDFAPDCYFIIRSRARPQVSDVAIISLGSLDQADLATFIRDSDVSDESLYSLESIRKIYRHTNGVVSRIESTLRDLEVTSVDDLQLQDPDLGNRSITISVPSALIQTIDELSNSEGSGLDRSFEFLKALSCFPLGEQMANVKRFNGPIPFHNSHAKELNNRRLVDSSAMSRFVNSGETTVGRLLTIPRPVRDYVRSLLSDEESNSLDRRALAIYFGDKWKEGDIATSPCGRRIANPLCEIYEIENASILIIRLVRESIAKADDVSFDNALSLVSSFVAVLGAGSHHRSVVQFLDDVLPLIVEGGADERSVTVIKSAHARSMRMVGRSKEAIDTLESIDLSLLDKFRRQTAILSLAMAYDRVGDEESAIEHAKSAIKVDRRSAIAIHAETIIAGCIKDASVRHDKLKDLYVRARKKDATVTANNIAIDLARENILVDGRSPEQILGDVVKAARKDKDFYNGARAILAMARRRRRGVPFGDLNLDLLIRAYHYYHTERMTALFDSAHAELWQILDESGEIENLLALFRHSSFIWRLQGRLEEEKKYLQKLAAKANVLISIDLRLVTRDRAYFVVRVQMILGTQIAEKPHALQHQD